MEHPPIGIDLGTTNSLIAVFENGAPRLLSNVLGHPLTPSVVSMDGKDVLVGEAGRDRLATHPRDTAAAFKRSMGTDKVFSLGGKRLRAEELSALVLRKLKEDAEQALGMPIRDVVVSVPAYFNQSQRQATMAACAMCELNPVRLVNEPTAAALAYGLQDRDGESQFLVFDLGGGTFDVTVLEHFDGVMEVKASSGDAFLGGEDFSEALAKGLADKINSPWAKLGSDDQNQLRFVADGLKRRLGTADSHDVTLKLGGESHDLTITRTFFETACSGLLKRLLRPIERCFYDSNESMETLDRVVFVGGATRMPMIRQLVARQFKKLPDMSIDPDHAVALGAAIQAGLVAEDRALDDVVMTDVSPFSVGIETATQLRDGSSMEGFFTPIIERNTALPASRERSFSTMADNQTVLGVDVYQGEAPMVYDNVHLGRFDLTVPRAKAGMESMMVRITYDPSGLIDVEAVSTSTGKKAGVVIRDNVVGLSDADIKSKLKAMQKLKLHPREDEENTALLARIKRLYEMASGDDRTMVQNLLVEFETALTKQDPNLIETTRGEISEVLNRIDDYYVS
ncbi:Hsp70 family protein [Ascidiaceihabitans sp.]|uniref:Hsp70 family protein n=1 Tax=Ascidiaceihabitans sp. TaxID=1872644 RepID=UPI00329754E8